MLLGFIRTHAEHVSLSKTADAGLKSPADVADFG